MAQSGPAPETKTARKERVALLSIGASAAITLGKLVAGILSGSLALLSEAAHSLVDTGATTLTYFAVRTANKPADSEHHYGHGKFESLAALTEMVILFILATVVVINAWSRLSGGGGHFEPTILAFVVLAVSIAIDVNRVIVLRRAARETGSEALAADAVHFSSDLAGSTLVVLGLIAALFGYHNGDALAAIGVAVFIAIAGWRVGRRTIDTLLDKAPDGLAEHIRKMVAAMPGVIDIEQVRLRPGGTQIFAEVTVAVSRTLPLDRVAVLKSGIIAAVQAALPDISLAVHSSPRALDDETVMEQVMLLAIRRRLPIHHIMVQNIEGRLSVSLDLEVDGRLSLGAAHTKASRLEAAIRDELGPETEVDTHIEPLQVQHLEGHDAPGNEVLEMMAELQSGLANVRQISDIHDLRVRRTPAGLVVHYHCYADTSLPVASVHLAVDQLEHQLRNRYPEIIRIVGHAEPLPRTGLGAVG